jgi:tetratricopeptide (TPR) repeat protein
MSLRPANALRALQRLQVRRLRPATFSTSFLKAGSRFWFAVTVVSQLLFATYIVLFYSLSAVHGHLGDRSRFFNHAYVAGDDVGNLSVAAHILFAFLINLCGALQLVPQVRARAPVFHRWNGRIFIAGAFIVGLAGLYLVWIRGSVGDLPQHLASTLDALLIFLCATLALRNAVARRFAAHRRWALRLFMVLGGVWFFRLGLFLWIVVNRGPVGFDPNTFTGPVLTFWGFGEYLVPLAILELYLRAENRGAGTTNRIAVATLVFAATIAMAAGTFATAAGAWLPAVVTAYQNRYSIVEPLDETIASRGIDEAIAQYHLLKTKEPSAYDFDEDQLNALGYKLIHEHKLSAAVRIFELNVQAYPKSADAYDSLGEGYMDAGDKSNAVANYEQSLRLNPNNRNADAMLAKLGRR